MYEWLRQIGRRHRVTLLSFVSDPAVTEAPAALREHCERVVLVPRSSTGPLAAGLRAAWLRVPHTLAPFVSKEMSARVIELASRDGQDLVQVEFVHMARYAVDLPADLPRVFRPHNVESEILEGYASHHRNPLLASYAALQASWLRRYEAAACARFDRCLAVTEADAAKFREWSPGARIETIPVGVDTDLFRPDALAVPAEPGRIATTGDYAWPPTADGLRFLVHDVFPRVRAVVRDARLSVIGRDPPDLGGGGSPDGVDVLGRVPDVRPEILRSALFVAPTRIGSGVRVKTLEALALGRPVVATSVGCSGIDVRPGEHLLVADDPDALAGHIVALLRDPERAARLGAAAAARVAERHAWSALAARFESVYAAVLAERRG
jgi:glycosyltransferase involved in cell wall biosynthesis